MPYYVTKLELSVTARPRLSNNLQNLSSRKKKGLLPVQQPQSAAGRAGCRQASLDFFSLKLAVGVNFGKKSRTLQPNC